MTNITDHVECLEEEDHQRQMEESIAFWIGTVIKLSVASIGITTNLVSIPILLNKEMTNTFNQVIHTFSRLYFGGFQPVCRENH